MININKIERDRLLFMNDEPCLKDIVDDNLNQRGPKTRVRFIDEETGRCLYEGHNKVIVSGSAFSAQKHFNITAPIKTPNYNTTLGLENIDSTAFSSPGIRREEQVFLFALGTDGCGAEQHQVYDVDTTKWIAPDALVPFRQVAIGSDIPDASRSVYFGRKVTATHAIYYFKAFEATPTFTQRYLDGTPITSNIYTDTKNMGIESFVELDLRIAKEDCREYFVINSNINGAKVNSISLLTAWPKNYTNKTYYQDIRPFTKINFPSEALINATKNIKIIYDIFY